MGKISAGKWLKALQKFAGMEEQNGKRLFFELTGRSRKQQISFRYTLILFSGF